MSANVDAHPLSHSSHSPHCPERRIASDERGAIMVMGIFMCIVLVGALWYIAGIGEALVFHERLQEAADSVAFSGAVIEARGMNIIVMMNLLMAAILAIRVAINLIKTVLIVAAAVFTALACIPFLEFFGAFVAPCADGAETMQNLDNSTKQPIDLALEGLHYAEIAVKEATPLAAWGGLVEMVGKYNVGGGVLLGPSTAGMPQSNSSNSGGGWGLPTTDGTLHKLCQEAGKAVGDIITALLDLAFYPVKNVTGVSQVLSKIGDLVGSLAGNDFFCELGDGSPPDTSNILKDYAGQGCQGKQDKLCNQATKDMQKCNTDGCDSSCNPPANATASQTSQCNQDNMTWSNDQSQCDNFDQDACNKQMQQDMKNQQQQAQQKANSAGTSSGSGGDKFPAKVKDSWHNGCDDAQLATVLYAGGNADKALSYTPKLVNVAAAEKRTINGLQDFQNLSWSQSEMFYDCEKSDFSSTDWTTCNVDGEDAMWNFYWRARFRMFNPSASYIAGAGLVATMKIADGKMRLDIATDTARAKSQSWGLTNFILKAELLKVAADVTTPLTLH
jgi:hypothetical protein